MTPPRSQARINQYISYDSIPGLSFTTQQDNMSLNATNIWAQKHTIALLHYCLPGGMSNFKVIQWFEQRSSQRHGFRTPFYTRWRHQMETISTLPVVTGLFAGNSPVPGEFPSQRPAARSFDVFFDLCLNKQLSKQSRRWWFETPSRPLWRHCNETSHRMVNRNPVAHILSTIKQ